MGMIYGDFGRFAIEGRRESFYIHADYGLEPYTCALSDVKLGAYFRDRVDSPPLQVIGQMIGKTIVNNTFATHPDSTHERDNAETGIPVEGGPAFAPVDLVENDHPLGRIWREHPHPEIENDDLGDLIAALEDYRSRLERDD